VLYIYLKSNFVCFLPNDITTHFNVTGFNYTSLTFVAFILTFVRELTKKKFIIGMRCDNRVVSYCLLSELIAQRGQREITFC